MKVTYRLDEAGLPTLPVPHDCVIQEIHKEDDRLVFIFEDDISRRDSIRPVMPTARSLIMTFHLTDTYEVLSRRWNRLRKRSEYIELRNEKALFGTACAYLCHYVAYGQIIVKLWRGRTEFMLTLTADSVEYDWGE